MITPQELRIGNKFASFGGKMIQTVLEILDNTNRGKIQFQSAEHKAMYSHLILCVENGNQYKPFEIEGIPLTEEWLIRFGLKKWGRDDVPRTLSYQHEEFESFQIFPANVFCDFTGYGFMWYKPDADAKGESAQFKLQYVHQLQNLFFIFNGQELTLLSETKEAV
jgi:hypothetical protein